MNLTELRENFLSKYYFLLRMQTSISEVTFHKGNPQYRPILTMDLGEIFEHLNPDEFMGPMIVMSGILYDTGNFTNIEWLNADETDVPEAPADDIDAVLDGLNFSDDDSEADDSDSWPYTRQIKQFASFNARIYYVDVTEEKGSDYRGFIIKHSNPKISILIKMAPKDG